MMVVPRADAGRIQRSRINIVRHPACKYDVILFPGVYSSQLFLIGQRNEFEFKSPEIILKLFCDRLCDL